MPTNTKVLTPRDAVLRMTPYSPPTAARADKLRLDFNENTVGCSPKVIEFLKENLHSASLTIYPEYTDAKRELAAFFHVAEAELLLTNGTDEAIQVLVNTYVDDGDEVLLMRPSYAMYRFYSELAGATVLEVDYNAHDLSFPVEKFLAAIRPATRAILIANPNNPTGTAIPLQAIERILAAAPNAAVLVDEAYFEFSGLTTLNRLAEYANLFVSRTFSKVYGMAAMRCGCLFSQAANVSFLHKAQSPYSVNMLAALAARAAVRDTDYVAAYVKEVIAARELIYEGLAQLGIHYYRSEANFVLFDAGDRAIEIRDRLRAHGILIRDRGYEIAGCVRVTVGKVAQAQRFLDELEKLWR